MRTIQHSEAEAQLNSLLDEVELGETVVITRKGKPVARLVPEPTTPAMSPMDAIAAIREFRKTMPKSTIEEIRSALHEGHRY